jgi:DNA-binding response OmpR family regulator
MLKVLIVEDNPLVLDLLREAIAPVASVSSASDAADALLRTVEDTPDLIIADYSLNGMDGLQLLEKLKARAATVHTPVILMAPKADIVERLKPYEEDVADFLAKPFFVKDAMVRIKRVLGHISLEKATQRSSEQTVVRGSLAQMNVIDLLQSLDMGRKTCLLSLTNADERCSMYFSEGQLVHATYDELRGDEAVFKALTWTDTGSFEIDFDQRVSDQTTTRSTQGLLMEGLRLLDEANRE